MSYNHDQICVRLQGVEKLESLMGPPDLSVFAQTCASNNISTQVPGTGTPEPARTAEAFLTPSVTTPGGMA